MAVPGIGLNFVRYNAFFSACEDAAQPEQEVDMLLDGSTRQ